MVLKHLDPSIEVSVLMIQMYVFGMSGTIAMKVKKIVSKMMEFGEAI